MWQKMLQVGSGGGSETINKTVVSSGEVLQLGVASGGTNSIGSSVPVGKQYSPIIDVSNVNSVYLAYWGSNSYWSSTTLGYKVDSTETQFTDYATSMKTKTVDLSNASEFALFGTIFSGDGYRGITVTAYFT